MAQTNQLINTDFRTIVSDGGTVPYPVGGTTTPLARDEQSAPAGIFGQIQQSVEAMVKGKETTEDVEKGKEVKKEETIDQQPKTTNQSHNIFESIAMKLLHMDPAGST
ncbi:MAG: hypothetical protein H6766_02890 [Candidatus Peribacteria bacterium]|nr:MAG: hypothetical protein H6766_02890 [Candidatus Peribacteria bacterium]